MVNENIIMRKNERMSRKAWNDKVGFIFYAFLPLIQKIIHDSMIM